MPGPRKNRRERAHLWNSIFGKKEKIQEGKEGRSREKGGGSQKEKKVIKGIAERAEDRFCRLLKRKKEGDAKGDTVSRRRRG